MLGRLQHSYYILAHFMNATYKHKSLDCFNLTNLVSRATLTHKALWVSSNSNF